MSKVSRNFKSHFNLSDIAHDLGKTPRVIVSSEPREFSCQFSFSSFLSFSEKDSFLISVTHRPLFLILSAWRNWACNRVIPPNFQITKVEKSEWVIRKWEVVRFRVSLPRFAFYLSIGLWNLLLFERKTSCIFRCSAHFLQHSRNVTELERWKSRRRRNAKVGAVLIFGTLPFEFLFLTICPAILNVWSVLNANPLKSPKEHHHQV